MVRLHFFIRLNPSEEHALNLFLKGGYKPHGLRARRRAQAVWFSHEKMTVQQIAQRLKVSERHVWNWLKVYQEKGLAGLKGKYFYRSLR